MGSLPEPPNETQIEKCHQEFYRKDRILSTGSTNVSNIFSDVSQEYIAVALQNSAFLFSVKTFDLIWSFQIDNPIGCISIFEDSCLLFLVDTYGMFHMYHIPTKFNIWKVMCPAEKVSSATVHSIITSIKTSGHLSVFIIFTNWVIFEISDVFISNLYKAIKNGNISNAFHEVKVKKLNLAKSHPNYSIMHIFPVYLKGASLGILYETIARPSPPPKLSMVDNSSMSDSSCDFSKDICDVTLMTYTFSDDTFLNNQTLMAEDISSETNSISHEECFFISNPHLVHALKVIHTRDGKFLIALSDNVIHTLSAEEGILCSSSTSNYPIEDFVINENICNNSESSEHKIGLKCCAISDNSHYIFEIRILSSFTLLYTVDLPSFMQLIRCIPEQNFWSIVSGDVLPRNSNESTVKNLVVSFFHPPSPDAILLNLIEKGEMREAEELARKQNFSLEIIHKTTIKNILSKFSQEDNETLLPEKVQEMWNNINNSFGFIKDPSFVKSCISCVLPFTEQEKQLLSCIQKRVVKMDQSKEIVEIILQVNQLLKRIITYQTLCTSLDSCWNLKQFLSQDLLNFMISQLNQGNLSAAFVVWQRHMDEFIVGLNLNTIENIIQAIPNTPSKILIPFLEVDFLPAIFLQCPDSIKTVASWIQCRVYNFEIFEKTLWPENGLLLLKVTLSIVNNLFSQTNENKINFSTAMACASEYKKPYCIGSLTEFQKYVTWIQTLKKDFNCTVQLIDFEDSKDVIFTILDQIDVKCISTVIDKFARPFALELGLDLDTCLEEYLVKTVNNMGSSWLTHKDDHMEEKLVTIINNIASSTKWTNASLVLLSKVAIPWSQRVQELVQKALKRNYSRRSEFLMQSKLVDLKEMVKKYDMKISTECLNRPFGFVFVNHIFEVNKPSALKDAEKVLSSFGEYVKGSDVHFMYLQFALNHNKIDDVLKCFAEISEEYGIKCASRLLKYIQMILDDLEVKDNELINNAQYIGVYLIKYLKKMKQPVDENLLIQFKCLEKLQEEFGLSLTLSELLEESNSHVLIKRAIHKYITQSISKEECELSEKSAKLPPGILQLYRLGHILLVKREKVLGFLITDCLKEKKYELVLILCNEIIDSYRSGDAAETLVQVIKHFYDNFRSWTSTNFTVMVNTIQHLTGTAMTYISEGSLLENLPLLQLTIYMSSIKEITGKRSLVVNPKDPYHTWNFSPLFQDQGFQLNFDSVMAFLIAVFNLQGLSSCSDKSIEVKKVFVPSKDLLTHMNDSGHTIVLLRTMYFVHILSLHQNQDPDVLQLFSGLASIIDSSAFSVIQHVVSQRKVDLEFALQLLYLVPRKLQNDFLNKLLNWCSRDLKILPYVASIGMQLAQVHQDTDYFCTYENIFRRAFFLNSHPVKSMSTELVLNPSPQPEHCWNLVKDLISSEKLDLSAVLGCCKAFRLKPEPVLMAYLKELLIRAECKSFRSENIKEHLAPALKEAEDIMNLINSDKELYSKLINFSREISPYSYEIHLFIKEQLQSLSANTQTCSSDLFEMDIRLLKFLEVYERISPPEEIEKEKCWSLRSENSCVSLISNTRLPFLYILQENLHKVINPELRENTLHIWLKVTPFLKISADDMIIISVRNSVANYLELLSSKHFVHNTDDNIIRSIENMIAGISNPESAVVSAYWVSMNMPPGRNRVKFALIAAKCAKNWFEKDPSKESAATTYKKMKSTYQKYSVESVLYKYSLLHNQLINLIQYPVQLIECLLENFLLSDNSNKVCETAVEIAKIADIKLIDIFFKYILNWLNVSPNTANNMDETYLESFKAEIDSDYDLDSKNLKRVIDLLMCISESLYSDLQNEVMKTFESMEQAQRNRLLFCLVSAFGYPFVAKAMKCDIKRLEENLLPMMCAMELKSLGFPYSSSLFKTCDKVELVGKILSVKINCPKAVIFCVRLCLEFDVWDTQLWEAILERFSCKSSDFAVQDILESVQGYLVHMWSNKSFIAAWIAAIDCIVKKKYADDSQFISTVFKTLLRCPCIHQLNAQRLVAEITANCTDPGIKESLLTEDISSLISILKVHAEKKCIMELSEKCS